MISTLTLLNSIDSFTFQPFSVCFHINVTKVDFNTITTKLHEFNIINRRIYISARVYLSFPTIYTKFNSCYPPLQTHTHTNKSLLTEYELRASIV